MRFHFWNLFKRFHRPSGILPHIAFILRISSTLCHTQGRNRTEPLVTGKSSVKAPPSLPNDSSDYFTISHNSRDLAIRSFCTIDKTVLVALWPSTVCLQVVRFHFWNLFERFHRPSGILPHIMLISRIASTLLSHPR